jgi:hypothetical protein
MKERMQQSTGKLLLLLQNSWWRHLISLQLPQLRLRMWVQWWKKKWQQLKWRPCRRLVVEMEESSKEIEDSLTFILDLVQG